MATNRPFYVGQRVVCINEVSWFCEETNKEVRGPKNREICTVSGYEDENFVLLVGYSQTSFDGFNIQEFRPLLDEELVCEN